MGNYISDLDINDPPAKRMKIELEKLARFASQNAQNTHSESISTDGPSTSKYGNFMTAEELDNYPHFEVLDEVKSDDKDSSSDSSDGLPEEEIAKIPEEDLPAGFKEASKSKEKPCVLRQKILLEEKGVNQCEELPQDWRMVRHKSGMPVYMHRGSRVCTLARPYLLGEGQTTKHEMPISALPCLAYRRALAEEKKQKKIDKKIKSRKKKQTTKVDNTNKTTNSQSNNNTKEIDFSDDIGSETVNINDLKTQDTNGNSDFSRQEILNKSQKVTQSSQKSTAKALSKDPFAHSDKGSNLQNVLKKVNGNQDTTIESDPQNENGDVQKRNDDNIMTDQSINADQIKTNNQDNSSKTQHLTPNQINAYCKKLFKFKTTETRIFKTWADRHKYTKEQKKRQNTPEDTDPITVPAQAQNSNNNGE